MPRLSIASFAFAGLCLGLVAPATAQDAPEAFFKDKTMRIVVGHPPGGSYDFYARLAADMLKASIPEVKAVIVENRRVVAA